MRYFFTTIKGDKSHTKYGAADHAECSSWYEFSSLFLFMTLELTPVFVFFWCMHHPVQEALEACQTRISKMELQQQQQQVVQLEGLENATARTLLGKLINVLLALMAVLLVFVSTVANCVVPLMKTRSRSLSTLILVLLLAFLWRNWDALSGYTHRALQPPG